MRVIFLQNVIYVARAGDVKEVKNGYARNYLIPNGLAAQATHNELQRMEKLKKVAEEQSLKESKQWKEVAEALDGKVIVLKMKSGETGQLYGSVTNSVIAKELAVLTQREIDRRKIVLSEPIRELGEFDVPIHLHTDIDATIKVIVEAEEI